MKIKIIIEMKFQFFAYFLPVILSLSCSDSPRQTKPNQNKIENKDPAKNKPPGSFSDTIKINSPAAVFYSPDSLQLEKIKSFTDAMIFESSMHDYFYQMRNAHFLLKNIILNSKSLKRKNVRYLLFLEGR